MVTSGIWKSSHLQKLSKTWLWKETSSEPRCLINFLSNMCSWLGASKKTKLLNVCSIIFFSFENRIEILPGNFFGAIPLPTNLDKCCSVNGEAMSEICRKANILANIDIWAQLHLLGIVGPRPKLHITVLLIKGKPWSQEMKKVRSRRLTKLSREKLVERRAWKLSELKKGKGNISTYFSQSIKQYLQIFRLAPFKYFR